VLEKLLKSVYLQKIVRSGVVQMQADSQKARGKSRLACYPCSTSHVSGGCTTHTMAEEVFCATLWRAKLLRRVWALWVRKAAQMERVRHMN
jgi:hypothetical protein